MLRRIHAVLLSLAVISSPVVAEGLSKPEGDIILTVSGAITQTNAEGLAQFDLAMLQSLGEETIVTSTIWTEGEQTFQGVSLRVLLDAVGVKAGTLRAVAINDYAVDIPTSDAVQGGPILAYKRNDDFMSLRDKGPLWVVYPYDSNADYRTEVVYSRSIWQLDRIKVTD